VYPDRNHGIYGGTTRLHLFDLMTDLVGGESLGWVDPAQDGAFPTFHGRACSLFDGAFSVPACILNIPRSWILLPWRTSTPNPS
jgi:hypothetical protein